MQQQYRVFVVGLPDFSLNNEMLAKSSILCSKLSMAEALLKSQSPDIWLANYETATALPIQKDKPIIVVCSAADEAKALTNSAFSEVLVAEHLTDERLFFTLQKAIKHTKKHRKLSHFLEKDWFKLIVQNASDVLIILDLRGYILYQSPSVQKVLGYSSTQLLGKNAFAYLHPDDFWNVKQLFRQPNYDRKTVATEFRCRDTKGEWVFFSAVGTNLLHEPLVEAIVVNMQDISNKRLTEKQLAYQHSILSKIQEAVIGLDAKFNIIYLNEAAENLYQSKFDARKNQPLSSLFLIGWATENQQKSAFDEIQSKGYWQGEVTHITHTGKQLQVDIVVQRLINQKNSLQEYLAIVRDISERKIVEVGLRQSEIRFKNLVESLSDLVWEIDRDGKFTYISPAAEKLLGYSPEELIGQPTATLMSANEAARTRPIFDAIKKSRKSFSYILVEHIHREGKAITIEVSGVPVYNIENEYIGYQGIMHDVTQRQQTETTIRNALKEKETLIKEIHHRVKNNMQVISSLLLLQSQQIQDERVLELYKESQMRIKSMALVHEKLYQSPDLSRIEFIGYIRSLTHVLASSNRNPNVQLQVETLSNEIYLSIDIAIPCGLIINELVSNAYKHAFPHGHKGTIKVALNFQEKTANYALIISDDGTGINLPEQKTSSLGLHLVKALTTQINGQFRYYNDTGAVFEMLFKDKN